MKPNTVKKVSPIIAIRKPREKFNDGTKYKDHSELACLLSERMPIKKEVSALL